MDIFEHWVILSHSYLIPLYFQLEEAPCINYVHSRWGYTFPVIHIPISGEDVHFQWGTSPFPVRMYIPGESHRPSWWGCLFHCDSSSPGMGRCLTRSANTHWEWGSASPGMGMWLTGNRDVPHRECISSPRMHIVYTGWEGCEDHLASIFHASLLDSTENHSSLCWESNISTEIAGKRKKDWLTPHLITVLEGSQNHESMFLEEVFWGIYFLNTAEVQKPWLLNEVYWNHLVLIFHQSSFLFLSQYFSVITS